MTRLTATIGRQNTGDLKGTMSPTMKLQCGVKRTELRRTMDVQRTE